MNRRMQAQEGPLQPTASSQRKEPEGQRPDSFPRAQGPEETQGAQIMGCSRLSLRVCPWRNSG